MRYRLKTSLYRRLSAGAERPVYDRNALMKEGYYSQCGQDKWLLENVFQGKESGIFVDIGAHDGVSFSNTLRMEQIGWCGVAIEPMPEAFAKLRANRRYTTLNYCISERTGPAAFRLIDGYSQMLSGLISEYDPKHLQRDSLGRSTSIAADFGISKFNAASCTIYVPRTESNRSIS